VIKFKTDRAEGLMKSIWILGAGRFGLKAAKKFSRKNEYIELTIVEKNSEICHQVKKLGINTVCMDGVEYLFQHLKSINSPDWIIPAIPVHVAYEWIRAKLKNNYTLTKIPFPRKVKTSLPNVFQGERGGIYISMADFMCPENCSEPDNNCPHTGKPRLFNLYQKLESIGHDQFQSVVVQSQQLFPGVGGYTPQALFHALDVIRSSSIPVLLSTACRCHGVMHAFKLEKE
jgi:hypothetical protein